MGHSKNHGRRGLTLPLPLRAKMIGCAMFVGRCRCDGGPSFFRLKIWTIFHKRRATYDIDNAHQKFSSFGIG